MAVQRTHRRVLESSAKKDASFQSHKRPKDRLPISNGDRNYGLELSKGEFVNWLEYLLIYNHINTLLIVKFSGLQPSAYHNSAYNLILVPVISASTMVFLFT